MARLGEDSGKRTIIGGTAVNDNAKKHQIVPFKKLKGTDKFKPNDRWDVTWENGYCGTTCDSLDEAIGYISGYIESSFPFWSEESIKAHCLRYGYAKGQYDEKEDGYWWTINH